MKLFINILVLILLTSNAYAQSNLDRYQQIAMENNLEVKAAYKAFEAAMQRAAQTAALPDPTLSFGFFISPVETRVGPQRAKISLSQMFPWFGALKAKGDVAAAEAQIKLQYFEDLKLKIQTEVTENYIPIVETAALIEIQKSNIEYFETVKSILQVRYENGKSSLSDILRIDLTLEELTVELKVLKNKLPALTTVFNNLLDQQDSAMVVYDSLQMPDPPSQLQDMSAHPRLKSLQLAVAASDHRAMAIQKSSYPSFGLGLDYVLVGERTDMSVADNGKDILMPMVSISLPIFRKKYQAALQETALQKNTFELKASAQINDFESAYSMFYYQWQSAKENYHLYHDLIKKTLQINELLITEFETGTKDLSDLLQVQIQLLKYERLKINALAKMNMVSASLAYINN